MRYTDCTIETHDVELAVPDPALAEQIVQCDCGFRRYYHYKGKWLVHSEVPDFDALADIIRGENP